MIWCVLHLKAKPRNERTDQIKVVNSRGLCCFKNTGEHYSPAALSLFLARICHCLGFWLVISYSM